MGDIPGDIPRVKSPGISPSHPWYCYKRFDIPAESRTFKKAIEDDFCKNITPGSHLASVHCVEEHYFIQSFKEHTHIGLHIPEKLAYNAENFKWTDGTPVDFVGWNRFSDLGKENRQEPVLSKGPQKDDLSERAVRVKSSRGTSGWSVNGEHAFEAGICKKEAKQYL
uniref:C-type lectin domain-containing protein n=1 Tax=Panagrellus redivivus TaxID=6233 RepID=A0A7E4ZTE7_PANRE